MRNCDTDAGKTECVLESGPRVLRAPYSISLSKRGGRARNSGPARRPRVAALSGSASLLLLLCLGTPGVGRAATRSAGLSPQAAELAQQAMITLQPPPDWNTAEPAIISTIDEIKAEFAKVTDTPPQVNYIRTRFLRPDKSWVTRFKSWFRSLEKPLRMRYENQLWDCDNYANCFVAFADLLALKAGESRAPFCVGWATVYYQRPFAGIRAGAHAVVIVGTKDGLFVIEPQDGTMVSLREFPNRHTIENVYF